MSLPDFKKFVNECLTDDFKNLANENHIVGALLILRNSFLIIPFLSLPFNHWYDVVCF